MWEKMSLDARSAIFLKAADLLSTKYRAKLNAAVMLGQSKTVWQAEIDAAVETVDNWRFGEHGPPAAAKSATTKIDSCLIFCAFPTRAYSLEWLLASFPPRCPVFEKAAPNSAARKRIWCMESNGVSASRGLHCSYHTIQLCRHCRQPSLHPCSHGQCRALETSRQLCSWYVLVLTWMPKPCACLHRTAPHFFLPSSLLKADSSLVA